MKYSSKKSKLSLTKILDRNAIFTSKYVDLTFSSRLEIPFRRRFHSTWIDIID